LLAIAAIQAMKPDVAILAQRAASTPLVPVVYRKVYLPVRPGYERNWRRH